jgi:hypothetical protein
LNIPFEQSDGQRTPNSIIIAAEEIDKNWKLEDYVREKNKNGHFENAKKSKSITPDSWLETYNGNGLPSEIFYKVSKGVGYIVIFCATDESYSINEPYFEEFLKTFEIMI